MRLRRRGVLAGNLKNSEIGTFSVFACFARTREEGLFGTAVLRSAHSAAKTRVNALTSRSRLAEGEELGSNILHPVQPE